jgi:protein subunit release factor A
MSAIHSSALSVIVEIRAAEGGDDAKLLVDEQLRIYVRRALQHGL